MPWIHVFSSPYCETARWTKRRTIQSPPSRGHSRDTVAGSIARSEATDALVASGGTNADHQQRAAYNLCSLLTRHSISLVWNFHVRSRKAMTENGKQQDEVHDHLTDAASLFARHIPVLVDVDHNVALLILPLICVPCRAVLQGSGSASRTSGASEKRPKLRIAQATSIFSQRRPHSKL